MTTQLHNKLINLSSILFVLIPLTLISGPFIPDLSLVIITINFITLTIINKKYEIFNSKFLVFFLLFCLIITIVSFFSLNTSSIQSSLFYFRFGLFSLAGYILIQEKKNLLNYTLYLILVIYSILFIDSIYQYKFGENLLGFKYLDQNFRITSLFGKDEILGSYSVRLLPLTLFLIIFTFNHSIIKKNFLFIFLLIFSSVIILLSGERTSLALFFLMILFLFMSSFNLRKLLIFPIIVSLIIFTLQSTN